MIHTRDRHGVPESSDRHGVTGDIGLASLASSLSPFLATLGLSTWCLRAASEPPALGVSTLCHAVTITHDHSVSYECSSPMTAITQAKWLPMKPRILKPMNCNAVQGKSEIADSKTTTLFFSL